MVVKRGRSDRLRPLIQVNARAVIVLEATSDDQGQDSKRGGGMLRDSVNERIQAHVQLWRCVRGKKSQERFV